MPRSLVLITVDCLRADHVGFLGYKRPTTPFLDSLANESVTFSNAIVAGAPTYYSFPALMASRYPLALGRDVVGLAPGESTLATVLKEAGYATAAFLAGNPYLSPRFGYDAGFDKFSDFLELDSSPLAGQPAAAASARSRWNHSLSAACHKIAPLGSLYDELYFQYCQRIATPAAQSMDQLQRFPSANVIVEQAAAWLASIGDAPFFLWLHLMDPHSPYYPPDQALEWMGHSKVNASRARYLNSYWNRGDLGADRLRRNLDEVMGLYDAGIRWVDAQLAHLVETLRHFRQWDTCVMAVTADHGEEFLDHGGRYHPPSRVNEELVRVPLLLHAPGMRTALRAEAPFSLLHLAPTLLEAVNLPVPSDFRGASYWPKLQTGQTWDGAAIAECITGCTNPFRASDRMGRRILAVREARYKLVFDPGSSTETLFDLEADPGERRPLSADAEKPVRKRLLERARRHVVESLQSRDLNHRLGARLRDIQLEWANSADRISA
jgi:arylsulfatase A-like enzyme